MEPTNQQGPNPNEAREKEIEKKAQQKADQATEEKGEEVKKDFKGLLGSVNTFLKDLLNIRRNTDKKATREAIEADIWEGFLSIFLNLDELEEYLRIAQEQEAPGGDAVGLVAEFFGPEVIKIFKDSML